MKKVTATAAALLCGLAASSASAQDPEMRGSDTLGPIMSHLLGPQGYNINPNVLRYVEQGSGNCEDALVGDEVEWCPMSRFLETTKAGDGCQAPNADAAYAGCWSVARDSLAVYGNIPQSCNTLKYQEPMQVLANGTGAPTGASYNFPEWRSVLRVIYGGNSVDGSSAIANKQCNSDLRKTLVSNWGRLFRGGCATGNCPNGLKHAFRRDDVSGTTAVFLQLLNLPGVSSAPFCNGTEAQDADPIRRACEGTGFSGNGESVCGVGPTPNNRNDDETHPGALGTGNLGLVLPVLIPSDPYGEDAGVVAQNCGAFGGTDSIPGGGATGLLPWALADVIQYGAACPNGQPPVGGFCGWPKPALAASATQPGLGCIAGKNDRPTGSPSGWDARVYNLWTTLNFASNGVSGTSTYDRGTPVVAQRANDAYYKYFAHDCRESDATGQIACFVANESCSIGFGGRSGIAEFGVRGLQLRGNNGQPAGPTLAHAANYPLARDLNFCQLQEFGAGNLGLQSAPFLGAQETIWDDVVGGDPNGIIADAAVAGNAFFSVPQPVKTCCSGTYNPATNRCQ